MKYLKLIFILLLCSILSGCIFDDPKYINLKSKPNLYYYSNEIYKKVKFLILIFMNIMMFHKKI